MVIVLTITTAERACPAKAEQSTIYGYKHEHLAGSLTACPLSKATMVDFFPFPKGLWPTKPCTFDQVWVSAMNSCPACGEGLRASHEAVRYPITFMPLLCWWAHLSCPTSFKFWDWDTDLFSPFRDAVMSAVTPLYRKGVISSSSYYCNDPSSTAREQWEGPEVSVSIPIPL